MKKIILLIFWLISFSLDISADESLIAKNILCSDLLWGFEFISPQKVKVINTDINNKTYVKEYYYENDSKLPYVNIYLMQKKRELAYSVHLETLRVDIWTMTSGGNTTREMIPRDFCKFTNISNILDYIEKLKINN